MALLEEAQYPLQFADGEGVSNNTNASSMLRGYPAYYTLPTQTATTGQYQYYETTVTPTETKIEQYSNTTSGTNAYNWYSTYTQEVSVPKFENRYYSPGVTFSNIEPPAQINPILGTPQPSMSTRPAPALGFELVASEYLQFLEQEVRRLRGGRFVGQQETEVEIEIGPAKRKLLLD